MENELRQSLDQILEGKASVNQLDELAAHQNSLIRYHIACAENTSEATLLKLSNDGEVKVRKAAHNNLFFRSFNKQNSVLTEAVKKNTAKAKNKKQKEKK